jgi:hypothetical protein
MKCSFIETGKDKGKTKEYLNSRANERELKHLGKTTT